MARFPFHDVGMRMAREGVGAIATLDSIVQALAPEGALQLVRRMADWETRLYLNPRISPDQARRLRQFFALVAARDEDEAMRAAAQEVAPRLRAN